MSEYELANGIRVKIMKTYSGTGTMAPVFVTVSGLTDAELTKETCPSEFCVLNHQDWHHVDPLMFTTRLLVACAS